MSGERSHIRDIKPLVQQQHAAQVRSLAGSPIIKALLAARQLLPAYGKHVFALAHSHIYTLHVCNAQTTHTTT